MNNNRKIFNLYIIEHHVFTLSVIVSGRPHSAPVFYAFDDIDETLIFMSDPGTIHSRAITKTHFCSGAIYDSVRNVQQIKGLQFSGTVKPLTSSERKDKEAIYIKKFPEAENLPGTLYVFHIEWMKMTDNSVSFGFKREWGNDPFS